MKIPKKIDILGKPYEIKKDGGNSLMGDNLGTVAHNYQVIYLKNDMAKEMMEETFLHEILHAITYHLGVKITEEQNMAISSGLYCLIKNNPGLFCVD